MKKPGHSSKAKLSLTAPVCGRRLAVSGLSSLRPRHATPVAQCATLAPEGAHRMGTAALLKGGNERRWWALAGGVAQGH